MIIISGGQTGADQGALFAAEKCGLPCEGWVPKGWRTDEGPAPWLAEHGLREHPIAQYGPRTIANVRMADALLWVGNEHSPGGRLTLAEAHRCKLVPLIIAWPSPEPDADLAHALVIRSFFFDGKTRRLMVAGNRERANPGIQRYVQMVLEGAIRHA